MPVSVICYLPSLFVGGCDVSCFLNFAFSFCRKEEATLERERKEREARRTAEMKMAAENQKVCDT